MANSSLLLLNHVYLLTCNLLDVTSNVFEARWTHAGGRDNTMSKRVTAFLLTLYHPCPSACLPPAMLWVSIFL